MTRARADHSEVRRLAALGRKTQTIATILGCCMEDVARILADDKELSNDNAPKLKPKAQPDHRAPRDERLREMWTAGILRVDICEQLGIGAATLDRDRRRLRLPGRQPPRNPRKADQ